jgi:UDP-N-acetylmuramoylalanine--D-glutamate ligase
MLDALLSSNTKDDIFVCELSSYQLDDIEYSPHIAAILNFFPDHLDYHGGVEEYWQAKARILAHATTEDYFIYNPVYPRLVELAEKTPAKKITFAKNYNIPEKEIPLLGDHNRDNIRAAIAIAKLFKVSDATIRRAVKKFKPLPHRLEYVGTFRNIVFFDDAISTTPESTLAGIEALGASGIISTIFLGGKNRGYDFSELARVIAAKKIPNIVFFPDSSAAIGATLETIGYKPKNALITRSMEDAVRFAYRHALSGTICLLSTASPSYSIWKNFEEKGDLFQTCVKKHS